LQPEILKLFLYIYIIGKSDMKYIDWQVNDARFRAMTGYDFCEFNSLLPYFEEAHNEYLSRYNIKGKPRKGLRSHVIYANSPLPCIEERLAFVLSYKKLNPIQEHHADTFRMTQKQCNEFFHCMDKILKLALKDAEVVPANCDKELAKILQSRETGETDIIETNAVEVEVIETDASESEVIETNTIEAEIAEIYTIGSKVLLHDGTEREIPRPVDNELQKDNYSGKKKKHSVKNAVIISACCLVLYVSRTFSGRVHDKTIADENYSIPRGYTLFQDAGYQGYRPEGVKIIQPEKKPRGKELTKEQKERNTKISSCRVRVEHAIGSVKRYRIVKDECRLRKNNYVDTALLYCAALHNFRLKTRPFRYENKLT
jgi:hypothetical protein